MLWLLYIVCASELLLLLRGYGLSCTLAPHCASTVLHHYYAVLLLVALVVVSLYMRVLLQIFRVPEPPCACKLQHCNSSNDYIPACCAYWH
jgi:hypothetical protein